MLIFFNVVAVINSVLSFFLLWLSFDANVRYNGWEVGVIRSLGVSAAQVVRVYVYEAVAVVLTAIMLGTIVGVLVSVVLTLQYNLFLELPFVFFFPVVLFVIVLILSLILSVVGAYVPANQFAKRTISNVIKGV
jgi:ABC-type antimicrobial peptide transport system permease subunit